MNIGRELMKKISKATVLVLSLIMIVGSTRVNSYAAETTNDILPKQILDIYFVKNLIIVIMSYYNNNHLLFYTLQCVI